MKRCIQLLDNYKKHIWFLCTLVICVLTWIGYRNGIFTEQKRMEAFLNSCGMFAPILFVLLQAVQVVIPILPGAAGCLYGVLFWGPLKGFCLNYIGICLGSVCAFVIARRFGQQFVRQITGGKFYEKYSKYLFRENQFEKLFALLIFLPVAPDDFLCYLAGISRMPMRRFTAIILLGKPAAILLYSMGLGTLFRVVSGMLAG